MNDPHREPAGHLAGGQPPRQTQSYLSQLFASQGLRAKKEFGQNFLVDLNLLDLLVRSARIGRRDVVLEVGAGTGGLTTRLMQQAGHVVSVEIDHGFHRLVESSIEGATNITLIRTDILAGKNKLEPTVMDAIAGAMGLVGTDHYDIVANFPYDVASSVIANCLLHDLPVRSMTFTVQYEAALKILSGPGSNHYGPLSILVAMLGHGTLVRTLPPSAFWPRPKVQSAFVRLDIDYHRKREIPDLSAFHHFVRQLFTHRRKNIRGGIASIVEYKPMKKEIGQVLESAGLDKDVRAEALAPQALYELFHRLNEWMTASGEVGER